MSMTDCEKGVARLIHIIVEHGEHVERARIELAKNPNFSPFTSFRRINKSTTGFLTEDDLHSFLREHGVNINEGGLKQFFSVEKDKSYGITYNNFLNQVLPLTDIELRNSCLERSHKGNREVSEVDHNGVDQLLALVYLKEYEYTRAIEANKAKLTSSNNLLVEKVFQSLADDVTGYLSFKSISAFMKHNNLNFGKKEYENFMSRIDKSLSGKVTPTDFKYVFFPNGISQINHKSPEPTHHKAASSFNGISPIKNWSQSPHDHTLRRPIEASGLERNDRSFSPLHHRSNNHSPNGKSHLEPNRKTHVSYIEPKHGSLKKSFNQGVPTTRSVLYNQEIAAINDQLILQNAPENSYYNKETKNPLEWRYLDPVYHNYWNYHRDHNRTLSPDYFNMAENHHHLRRPLGNNPAKTGANSVPFFNPSFVDPGAYENLERYPDNPFRYTDHGHFFKNYYSSLRHNYYDKYYNYIPYKAKVIPNKSEVHSRNSPVRSKNQSRDVSPSAFEQRRDPNMVVHTNPNPQRYHSNKSQIEEFMDKPNRKARDFSAEPLHRQSSPQVVENTPYQYVFVPESSARPNQYQEDNELKSSIKIEGQRLIPSPKLKQNLPRDSIVDQQRPTNAIDSNSKPYTFVILNK